MLVTDRLALVPWAPEHDELLVRLGADPRVMEHIGHGALWLRDHALAVAARVRAHWAEHGFGWRPAIERATGDAVGFIGMNLTDDRSAEGLAAGELEIGWWLDPACWGRGFAAEGGAAVRDHALAELGAASVIARINRGNGPSAGVARRIGLVHERDTVTGDGVAIGLFRGPSR